jgi:ATP-binding protein involved in chromosome partitioning
MAKRSFLPVVGVIENMSGFICAHGEHHAVFGSGGGQALADAVGAPLLGSIPIEADLAAGGDAGRPVILDSDGPAAMALREIVERLRSEVMPAVPSTEGIDMAGCSARLLAAVESALADADAEH